MRDAEKAVKVLTEKGDTASVEVIQKLMSEVRVLRSQARRLSRNKKALCERLESLDLPGNP